MSAQSIYQPYTYLVGWTEQDRWYYGVRFAKGCNPDDLWVKYFTSSKYVKQFRKQYGEPDVIQVRKTFDEADRALRWEERVLTKVNALHSDKWINKAVGRAIINEIPWNKGKKFDYERKQCIHCNRYITVQNFSRHLYSCTNGADGIKPNQNRKGIKLKSWAGRSKVIHQGTTIRRIPVDDRVPEGWILGGIPGQNKGVKKSGGPRKCITNGIKTRRIPIDDQVPVGWKPGRHYKPKG